MNDRVDIKDIEKWTMQIENIYKEIEVNDSKAEEMLSNMKAYVEDSKYFLEKGDLVRSFEAVVWAMAIFETCRQLEIFKIK